MTRNWNWRTPVDSERQQSENCHNHHEKWGSSNSALAHCILLINSFDNHFFVHGRRARFDAPLAMQVPEPRLPFSSS
jgi:hypothetical protein